MEYNPIEVIYSGFQQTNRIFSIIFLFAERTISGDNAINFILWRLYSLLEPFKMSICFSGTGQDEHILGRAGREHTPTRKDRTSPYLHVDKDILGLDYDIVGQDRAMEY